MSDRSFWKCIDRIQKGDKEGLREIYEAYLGYIYTLMLSIVKNKEVAEDLTADYFIRLWNRASQFRPGGGHKMWMSTIARNMAIDWIRKQKLDQQQAQEKQQQSDNWSDPSAEDEVMKHISFKESIAILPEDEQQILAMKLGAQMTFKEIAGIMGMPIGTVTWKYQQSIHRLRKAGV